jgi:hypothetical protein
MGCAVVNIAAGAGPTGHTQVPLTPRAASSMAELWTFNRRMAFDRGWRNSFDLDKWRLFLSIMDFDCSWVAPLSPGCSSTVADAAGHCGVSSVLRRSTTAPHRGALMVLPVIRVDGRARLLW